MERVISEIIDVEHEAQKITQEAFLLKQNLQEDIKTQITAMREERFKQADVFIASENEKIKQQARDEIEALKTMYDERIEVLAQKNDMNRKMWIDDIYKSLVGR